MLSTKTIPLVKLQTEAEEPREEVSSRFYLEQQELLTKAQAKNLEAQMKLKAATTEAAEIIQQAEEEANRLKQKAEAEGYQLGFDEGKKEGYQAGLEAGEAQAKSEYLCKIEELRQAWFQVNENIEQELTQLTPDLIELLVQGVQSLTYQVLDRSDEKLKLLLDDLILTVSNRQRLFIRVSPEWKEQVQSFQPEWSLVCPKTYIQVIGDPLLGQYDCVLETEIETIDLSLDTQLEALKEALLKVVPK